VLTSIQLHSQHPLLAEEVQDERPARMLTPKLEPSESSVAQVIPKRGFRIGTGAAKLSAAAKRLVHRYGFGASTSLLRPSA
jgi:hypothetical protein